MAFNGGPLDGQPVTPEALSEVDQGGGLDLASLMQGMGGGGPMGAPGDMGGGGMPPELGPPAPEPDAGEGALDPDAKIRRIMVDLMSLADPNSGDETQEEMSGFQQMMSILQKIKEKREKVQNDALGGKIAPQLLSKQYASAGG